MPKYFLTRAFAQLNTLPRLYSHKTFGLLGLVCLISGYSSSAQSIPKERLSNWSNAGTHYRFGNYAQAFNFVNEGALNNGSEPNDEVIEKLLAKAGGKKTLIYFPAGSYYFTKGISLPSHITLSANPGDSTTLIFRLSTADHLISVKGEGVKFTAPILGDALRGSRMIRVQSSAALKAGDYIRINDDDSVLVASDWAKGSTGQIVQIDSVADSSIYLHSELRRSFLNSRNARFSSLEMKEGVSIENLQLVRLDTTQEQSSNIYFEYSSNSMIRCVASRNCNYAHFELRNSSNIELSGNFLQQAFSYGDGGKGYGILLHFASSECLIRDNTYSTLRHAMVMQAGSNGNVFAYNYSIKPYWTGVFAPPDAAGDLVLHGNYPYANLFEGNVVDNIVIDESHGINGPHNIFFRNRADNYGIVMSTNILTDSQVFVGNEITANGLFTGKFIIRGVGHFLHGNNVKGILTPSTSTANIPESSLFLDSVPEYYLEKNAWPPIGYPNILNTKKVEVQTYFQAGQPVICFMPATSTYVGEKEEIPFKVQVYPNPSASGFNVNIPDCEELKNVSLYSPEGKLLWSGLKTYIPSKYPPGVYFLKIELKNRLSHIEKVIISAQ